MTEATSLVDALTPEMSRRDSMALLIRAFEAAGIADAASDARLLLCAAADIDHADLIRDPEAPLDEFARELLAAYGQRRFAREPVTRILGTRGVWILARTARRLSTRLSKYSANDRMTRFGSPISAWVPARSFAPCSIFSRTLRDSVSMFRRPPAPSRLEICEHAA